MYLFYYLISFIIFIVLFSLVILFVKVSNNTKNTYKNKETFIELKDKYEDDYRQYGAVQACRILDGRGKEITQPNKDIMDSVLKSNRINVWKPDELDPTISKKQKDKHYCYIYNDEKNKMVDPLMLNGCDAFKQHALVSDTFETSYPDKIHTLPVNKCVLEIDPKKVSSSNINSFWDKWGDTRCEYLTSRIQKEIDEQSAAYTSLSNLYIKLDSNNDTYIDRLSNLRLDGKHCYNSNNILATQMLDLHSNNEATMQILSDLTRERQGLSETYRTKSDEKDKLEEQRKINADLCMKFTNEQMACSSNLLSCRQDKSALEAFYKTALDRNNSLNVTNRELISSSNDIFKKYEDAATGYFNCSTNLEDKKIQVNDLEQRRIEEKNKFETCEVERLIKEKELASITDLFNWIDKEKKQCFKDRNALREENKKCGIKNQKCTSLRNEESLREKQLSEVIGKLKMCNESRVENNKTISSFEGTNIELYNELERLIAETEKLEKDIYDKENEDTNNYIENLLSEQKTNLDKYKKDTIEDKSCAQKKEAVENLKKIQNEIAHLEFQDATQEANICNNCVPTLEQCKRYKNNKKLCNEDKKLKGF